MGKLDSFIRSCFSVALESIPLAGKMFEVLHEMEDRGQFEDLKKSAYGHSHKLDMLVESIGFRVSFTPEAP